MVRNNLITVRSMGQVHLGLRHERVHVRAPEPGRLRHGRHANDALHCNARMAELEHKHPVEPVAQKHPQLPRTGRWLDASRATCRAAQAPLAEASTLSARQRAASSARQPARSQSEAASYIRPRPTRGLLALRGRKIRPGSLRTPRTARCPSACSGSCH
jgi:hypothetical protein